MTTPTNNRQPVGFPDDLPPLPPDAAPWQSAGCRDENARLLVGAMYRQREALLRAFPDVPVQGYDVALPADGPDGPDGPDGALTCGVLVTLWRRSDLCRGQCPHCGDTALAMSVGGTPEDWVVVGVCPNCASQSFRQLKRSELLGALAQSLEGTGYALPTESQLLLSNAHQHLALLGALRAAGERLLPPDHYGFTVAMPAVMRGWASASAERVRIWARRGSIIHIASDAVVEKNETLLPAMMKFVHEYLLRTGTLPELDHAGPDGLRYSFPMSSQEQVVLPLQTPDEEEESDWDDADDSEAAFQSNVDALIARMEAGGDTTELLQRIQEKLESDPDWTEREAMGMFLSPTHIQDAYEDTDDDTVREALELRQNQRVTPARRIQFLEQYVLPALCDDADVTHMFVSAVLTSSDGDELTLMASIQGYSFTIIRTEWWGVVESEAVFRERLLERGWIEGVEAFQKLSAKRKLAIVTGETQARASTRVTPGGDCHPS